MLLLTGGAFGGKSTDSLVCAGIAAVGAWKYVFVQCSPQTDFAGSLPGAIFLCHFLDLVHEAQRYNQPMPWG